MAGEPNKNDDQILHTEPSRSLSGSRVTKIIIAFVSAAIGVGIAWYYWPPDDEEIPWNEATLSPDSIDDPDCLDEVAQAVQTILVDSGLPDARMRPHNLEELVAHAQAEQFIRLYGNDQIRHWRFAHFDDLGCSLYNHQTTTIDLATRDHTTQPRPVSTHTNQSARHPLKSCHCH